MAHNIVVAGLGGQGVIFLTRLLARAATGLGYPVLLSETHGMSQRGGSVVSHLKIAGNLAPLIAPGTADVLLALEASEAVRHLPFLRRGGLLIVNSAEDLPPSLGESLARLDIRPRLLPAADLAREMGSPTVANVMLAGFAAAHPEPGLTLESLEQALAAIAPRNRDLNLKALRQGHAAGAAVAAPGPRSQRTGHPAR